MKLMKSSDVHKNIENALRAERPAHQVSPGFAERVIDALPARPTKAKRSEAVTSQKLWPRLAFAAALCLAVFLAWRQFAPQTPEKTPIIVDLDRESKPLDIQLPPVSIEQVRALTEKIDQPLEKELERVLADTRNAIQFVASNFIPEN
jgi:hypothetical protein